MEIPYTVQARPDTGLWNAKVGIWLFLASEVMLFGGLFSSYIFLRVGADFPWPVHTLTVMWGFINTLVLIFSSVTVLQAWLALKRRKYGQYQVWMALTIACALGFMVIKSVEYADKYHHYGVMLNDGSVVEGHLAKDKVTGAKSYSIHFTGVHTVTLASQKNKTGLLGLNLPTLGAGSDAAFLKYLQGDKPAQFKDATILVSGEKPEPSSTSGAITLSAGSIKSLLAEAVAKATPVDDKNRRAADENYRKTGKMVAPSFTDASVKLAAVEPLDFAIDAGKLATYDGTKATFRDGTVLEGKLADDTLNLEADKVDLRRLFDAKKDDVKKAKAAAEKAGVWDVLGPKWKEQFFKNVEAMEKKFSYEKNPMHNGDFVREAFSWKPEDHHVDPHSLVAHEGAPAGHGGSTHDAGGPEAHPSYPIAKKNIHFFSNFLPKYNNYYAIYFTLTGLHGLHVLAGALVLTHFLLFGKKLYLKNPEHLANRVETGGLFWHFVDLIWIFLFPLLYLM
jgi:heme/copper-type cytochrome/quinol oxidase subunit 3